MIVALLVLPALAAAIRPGGAAQVHAGIFNVRHTAGKGRTTDVEIVAADVAMLILSEEIRLGFGALDALGIDRGFYQRAADFPVFPIFIVRPFQRNAVGIGIQGILDG